MYNDLVAIITLPGMSELDLDNESLPSDSAASPGSSQIHALRRPYGTLRIQEEDELVSSSQVLEHIHNSQGRYHRLDINHCDLGDAKLGTILNALHPRVPVTHSSATTDDGQTSSKQFDWLGLIAPLSAALTLDPRPPYASFRILELDNNNLTSHCLPAICKLLTGNLILHTLSLKANQIGSNVEGFVHLAQALGKSSLRRLCLSSNPIMPDSLAAFFDALPGNGTSLECLELSDVLQDQLHTTGAQTNDDQALVAANAIANFIGDSQRCRSLYALLLNANNFGTHGIGAIALTLMDHPFPKCVDLAGQPMRQLDGLQKDPFFSAITRTISRTANRSLELVNFHGSAGVWRDTDVDEEVKKFHDIRQRYSSIPLPDIETIASFLDLRAREKGMYASDARTDDLPIDVSRHLPKIGISLDQCEHDFQHAVEIGVGLTSLGLALLASRKIETNEIRNRDCGRAATAILGPARILGCRAKRAMVTTNGLFSGTSEARSVFHKFLDLPPEIRLVILRHLDTKDALSARQFSNVISFACEPTTIGYGSPGYDWRRVQDPNTGSPHGATSSASSTLPAQLWRWDECFALRAVPRDWSADLLDATDATTRHLRTRTLGQRLCRPSTDPAMYAFLESTLTHRAECRA